MEPSINPYQSPEAESPSTLRKAALPPSHEGWKYILLAVTILGGLASFVPWLAAIFLILSAPLFIRYALRARRTLRPGENASLPVHLAGGLGAIGIGLSVLAASAGACLGTCTIFGWGTQLTGIAAVIGDVLFPDVYLADVGVSLYGGGTIGLIVFIITAIWLFQRHIGKVHTPLDGRSSD